MYLYLLLYVAGDSISKSRNILRQELSNYHLNRFRATCHGLPDGRPVQETCPCVGLLCVLLLSLCRACDVTCISILNQKALPSSSARIVYLEEIGIYHFVAPRKMRRPLALKPNIRTISILMGSMKKPSVTQVMAKYGVSGKSERKQNSQVSSPRPQCSRTGLGPMISHGHACCHQRTWTETRRMNIA